MKVLIVESARERAEACVRIVLDVVRQPSERCIGVATGSTPRALYAALAAHVERGVDLSGLSVFALDEYVGLPVGHPQSYHSVVAREVSGPLRLDPRRVHVPLGSTDKLLLEAFERQISASGGIALQILGIGSNGHIGFNEPGSSFSSRTRVVRLASVTRQANARFFPGIDDVPELGVTQGIGTILDSRRILLLATGHEKADAVAAALEAEISRDCPASALRLHADVTFVLDPPAASRLTAGHWAESAPAAPCDDEIAAET